MSVKVAGSGNFKEFLNTFSSTDSIKLADSRTLCTMRLSDYESVNPAAEIANQLGFLTGYLTATTYLATDSYDYKECLNQIYLICKQTNKTEIESRGEFIAALLDLFEEQKDEFVKGFGQGNEYAANDYFS